MFSFLKRKPQYEDAGLEDLARMLTDEEQDPTHRRELLSRERLDYSLDSLKHIDEYLEALHKKPPVDQDLMRVVLRCGAYVGEVIRRHSRLEYHWLAFAEAARLSPFVKNLGMDLGSAVILCSGPERMCFPLGKVCKYLENGSEDSVYFFAKMILDTQESHETVH